MELNYFAIVIIKFVLNLPLRRLRQVNWSGSMFIYHCSKAFMYIKLNKVFKTVSSIKPARCNSSPSAPQIAMDIKVAKRELKKARTVLQMDELKCRKRVLRRLGFATSSDVIEMKGRVACEISR